MTTLRNKVAALATVLCMLAANSYAQNSLYFMERMPQTQHFNPALQPHIGFFLNFPGISLIQTDVYNSGFSFGELEEFMDRIEDKNYDPDDFVQKTGSRNLTTAETRVNLLGLGFRLKEKGYLSLSFSQRNILQVTAPSNVGYLAYSLANDDWESLNARLPIDIRGLDIQMNAFSQIAITWTRNMGKGLTLGISPKLTGGIGAYRSDNLNARLTSELVKVEFEGYPDDEFPDYYLYEANYSGNVYVGLPVPVNPDAIGVNNERAEEAELISDDGYDGMGLGGIFQNPGVAFDLGVRYELNEQWSFSASLLDLGNVSWKKNGYRLEFNQGSDKIYDDQAFKMKIPAKLFAGAGYSLSPRWRAGFLLKNVFYQHGSFTSATLSMNGYVGRMLSATFSYTAAKTFDNLGLGLRLRIFPGTDLYGVTDNLLQFFSLRDARHVTAAFGLNFSFGVR